MLNVRWLDLTSLDNALEEVIEISIPSIETLMKHPFVDCIREWEGWFPEAYRCPAGKWTIGYGHLCSPEHDPIDKKQGEKLLAEDLLDALKDVKRLAPNLEDEPDYRAIALASWVMNLGGSNLAASTMLKRIRAGKWEEAAKEMRRWDKITSPVTGRKVALRGLTKRRQAEAKMFLTGEI